MRTLRIAYQTDDASVCPRCGAQSAQYATPGNMPGTTIKTYMACRICRLRTLAFHADHPPRHFGWIQTRKDLR